MNLFELLKLYQGELQLRGRSAANKVIEEISLPVGMGDAVIGCFDDAGNPIDAQHTVVEYVFEVTHK